MKSLRLLAIGTVALAAITASAQQNYNPGTMTFKRSGHNQWGKPGEFGLLDYTKKTERGDVDIPFGAFIDPPVAGLIGAGVVLNLSGAIGIHIQVWGKNGELSVEYPCGITLTYPNPKTLRPGDPFTITSAFTRSGTGSMSSTAPDFGFSIGGLFDLGVKLDAGVWLFDEKLFGKNLVDKSWEDLEVGLFNTDLPGFKEAVNLSDGHFELLNGIVEGNYGFPHVTTTGGNGPGDTLTSTGSDEFLSCSLSITDAILTALGLPFDLNGVGGTSDFWGEFTWDFHILDLRLEGGFSILQDFNFTPKPVVELAIGGVKHRAYVGDPFNLTMPAPVDGVAGNNLVISPSFSMEGTVNNHSQLKFEIGMVFDPFSLIAHVKVGGEIAGEFFGLDEHIDVGIDPIELFSEAFYQDLVDKNFEMKGFNVITKPPFTVEGYQYPKATVSTLEPAYVAQNSGALSLKVTGNNFVQDYTNGAGTVNGSRVNLIGSGRTTTYVSSSVLNAAITAADTSTEGRKAITVVNPAPGGGASNPVDFIVDGSAPTITGSATPVALDKTGNPNVLITCTVSGKVTDLLSGVDVTTGSFSVVDEYGLVQPSGTFNIDPVTGNYSFPARLSPTRQGKDKDGRKYVITIKAKDRLGFQGTKVVNVIVLQ